MVSLNETQIDMYIRKLSRATWPVCVEWAELMTVNRSPLSEDHVMNTICPLIQEKKRLLFCPIASCFNEKKRCHDETSSPISLQRAAPLHHYPTRVVYFEFFLSNSTIPCTILCFLCSYISAHEIHHSKLLRLNQVWKTKDVQKRYISGAEGLNTAIVRYNNEEEKPPAKLFRMKTH